MKKITRIIVLILVFASGAVCGQELSIKQKNKIIKELSGIIRENYVLQDSVEIILTRLKEAQRTEDYKNDHTSPEFATYLTQLLRTITQDAHFASLHDPRMYKVALAMQQGDESAGPQNMSINNRNLSDSRKNFFFRNLEIMDGNVGYMRIEQMPPLDFSKETVDAAMRFVRHTDALIIDLRSNPGGVGGFIPYLISYFTPGRQLLYSREFLAWDSTSYHYTHEELGSKRYLDKPVYLLINRFTGSAATNMSYTMQSFDLAVLVGENTGAGYRGAHSATLYPLAEDLVGIVPIGRVVNAKTNTNWRSNGVDPDIPSDPEKALDLAYETILRGLLTRSENTEVKSELEEALKKLKAKAEEAPVLEDLSEYTGQYGETTISLENDKLFTKRPTVPVKLEIRRKEGEVFEIILPPNVRGNVPVLRFNRENGVVTSLTTIRDGAEERTETKN